MHGGQGTGQAHIRHSGDEARTHARLLRVVEQPAQQLDEDHLEQPIDQQAVPAAHPIGFGEQQFQRQIQAGNARQRQHHQRRQCAHEGAVDAAFEVQPGARQIGAFRRRIVEAVRQRARIEQQCRFIQTQVPGHLARMRVAYLQAAPPQDVQVSALIAVAVIRPTPEAAINRRLRVSRRAISANCFSMAAIAS